MSELLVAVDDGVAVVTLNAPERRNALTDSLIDEIIEAFDDLEARGDVHAVVITGAGKGFCAGAALDHLAVADGSGMRRIYEGFLRVGRSPLPTIAAVNGSAVGAGMNLALCCDVRVTSPHAKFITRFIELGLFPGGGHTWMLNRILGPQGATALTLFGDELGGEEAARVGLAWRCVPADDLLDECRRLAAYAAAGDREMVQRVKHVIGEMPDVGTHEAAVELELGHQVWSLEQGFFRARLDAIQQRISSKE